MDDYGPLVYLDVQKTGSTFVSRFLEASCTLPRRRFVKHGRIGRVSDPGRFCFITLRDPEAQYLSLFRFGLDGRGSLLHRLEKAGQGGLYRPDGYRAWLEFMLDPAHASVIGENFDRVVHLGIGLQTWRFLALSLPRPLSILAQAQPGEVPALYRRHNLARAVLRTERLAQELREKVVAPHPGWFDAERAEAFLAAAAPIKPSVSAVPVSDPGPRLRSLLREREAFLYDTFAVGAEPG